jgi:hypothetical protein
MNGTSPSLLFVYNADSGRFNTLADIGHKFFSPQTYACNLCALTHGYFSEKSQWRAFVDELGTKCEFLHRDQFRQRYSGQRIPLPAVFLVAGNEISPCINAEQLRDCKSLKQLKQLVRKQCLKNNKSPK